MLRGRRRSQDRIVYKPVQENENYSIPRSVETVEPKYYSKADSETQWVCGIGYEVRQLKEVDCVAQRFFCDFTLCIKWYDPANRALNTPGIVESSHKVQKPEVMIANATQVQVRDTSILRIATDAPGVLHCETVYTGVLSEFMELELFPLDVQDLTIAVRMRDHRWKVRVLSEPHFRMICPTVELAEWQIFEPLIKVSRDEAIGRPTWELKLKVFRKHDFYMSNVIFMVGGIASLTFFAFLFRADHWEQRSTYSATLLLTSVAFKFVVSNSLPKVSFFTVLDVYLFASFCIMVVIIIESAVMKVLYVYQNMPLDTLASVDFICALSLLSSWVLMNVAFLFRFHRLEVRQRRELGELLPFITTNSAAKGAMAYLLTGEVDSEGDGGSDNEL